MAGPPIADTGGLLRAIAKRPDGRPSWPAYSRALAAASRVVVPAAVLVEVDYFLRANRPAMRQFVDELFDPTTTLDFHPTTEDDVVATLRTAAVHCSAHGVVAVLPDCVRESFEPDTDCGGEDGDDGRAFRYLEWTWDPDPTDHTYIVDYVFTMREQDGTVRIEHDRHVEGLFSRSEWVSMFAAAGLAATSSIDPWDRDVFIARHAAPA